MHEIVTRWLADHGEVWKKKVAARAALDADPIERFLPVGAEALVVVLRRGRLDLAAFIRGADAPSLVAMADVRGVALHAGLDLEVARTALAALAPLLLDVARRETKNEEGVERLLAATAGANQLGALGDLAHRLYRQQGT